MDAREAEDWLKQHGVPPPTPDQIDLAIASAFVQLQLQCRQVIGTAQDMLDLTQPEPLLDGTEIQANVESSDLIHCLDEEELRKVLRLLYGAMLKILDVWNDPEIEAQTVADRDQIRAAIIADRKKVLGS